MFCCMHTCPYIYKKYTVDFWGIVFEYFMPLERQRISRGGHRLSPVCRQCHLSPQPLGILCTLQQGVPPMCRPCTSNSHSVSKPTSCCFCYILPHSFIGRDVEKWFLHHLLHVTLILAFLVISSKYCLSLFWKNFQLTSSVCGAFQ